MIDLRGYVSITDVLHRHGYRVDRNRSLCPFHEDTHPSLHVSKCGQLWHCFVCEAKGGVVKMLELLHSTDFNGVLHILKNDYNVPGISTDKKGKIVEHKLPVKEEPFDLMLAELKLQAIEARERLLLKRLVAIRQRLQKQQDTQTWNEQSADDYTHMHILEYKLECNDSEIIALRYEANQIRKSL